MISCFFCHFFYKNNKKIKKFKVRDKIRHEAHSECGRIESIFMEKKDSYKNVKKVTSLNIMKENYKNENKNNNLLNRYKLLNLNK